MTPFLVDAQLPRRLVRALQAAGLDAVHTLDLPQGNASKDSELNRLSLDEQRIVITKDADFVQSFILLGQPYKLLLVNTGNINNNELLALFESRRSQLLELFDAASYVEMTREFLIVHS